MGLLKNTKDHTWLQYVISLGVIASLACFCYFFIGLIGFRVVALILLLAVSILAMIFDIWTVLVTAIFSALVWNFFFIPPIYDFTIGTPEDILLFLMYFAISMVNAVLTSRIRKSERRAKEREERERTIRLYNTLLNSLSHELRTPISTIIGAVDTLKDGSVHLSEANRKELLTEIDLASTRLNRQVENLLNMSRLESGFFRPRHDWCDMTELVHRVIRNASEGIGQQRIRLVVPRPVPLFRLDGGITQLVLDNLVHNAIQYTPEDSIISLELGHYADGCRVRISDNGPGFPEHTLERVFEKFFRLPNSVTGGTGLGLSIVKGFVEAMNGEVTLVNNPGGGATFTVNIPAEVSYANEFQNECHPDH